ncbi:ribosomal protein S18-alanine N-acetyltransferase [Gilvimarinus xylanilyticus]|uniref:[Ribosomal protein bS18]-alanine N-acetyltransferase n=1 Tax=Gilvimarinus xylanilyticus TaxID=2944139 RepID=A0A9X2I6G8_9GAMM|nr:ribosomal protein S18-alanine N-acetyltransferase [Gilvimarinus xylanilyticus]MCP8900307.1 ribosomal protein S18-alanine N-acetyltransferase [Gilvimarinus xylanilyticus]
MAFKPLDPNTLTGDCQTATGETLTLRPLTEADIEPLCEIEKRAHSHPWSRRLFTDCLHSRQRCILIFTGRTLVGYFVVTYAAGSAELLNIAIDPSQQGKGLAFAALTHLIQALNGVAETLYLEVRESNQSAIALYQKLGFAEVGIRPNYYPAAKGREDAVIMAFSFVDE